jgi:predicted negative regulator of RcsB-dependent stress response
MIDIQENLSTIIIIVLICIIIYLGYNYYLFKQKILLLEKNITELNKIKYLENEHYTNSNINSNNNLNNNPSSNPNYFPNNNTNYNSKLK